MVMGIIGYTHGVRLVRMPETKQTISANPMLVEASPWISAALVCVNRFQYVEKVWASDGIRFEYSESKPKWGTKDRKVESTCSRFFPIGRKVKLSNITKPLRVAVRTHEIGLVVLSSGLASSFARLGFELGKRGVTLIRIGRPQTTPLDAVFGRELARLFIRLGPTFIKLGQMLASRPDIIGPTVSEELKSLYDRVPPTTYRKIKKVLDAEIGRKKLKKYFRSIDPKPLASASLAQTHRAVLDNGDQVILKIQKPGSSKTVETDLLLLEALARSVDVVSPKLQAFAIFRDFKQATLREIDYREEAKNIDRFQHNYRGLFTASNIRFPGYVQHLTTARVITLEPMQGTKVSALKKGTTVARRAATKSLEAVLEQIFDHGFFHADPHAGNLFFLEETGEVGFIDLGLVGQLEPSDKRRFLRVLFAILKRDRRSLATHLYELGEASPQSSFDSFESEINRLIDDIGGKDFRKTNLEGLVMKLFGIARRQGVFIPNRYTMLLRSCLIIEGVARSLDPGLSVVAIATPIVARSLLKSYNPFRLFTRR